VADFCGFWAAQSFIVTYPFQGLPGFAVSRRRDAQDGQIESGKDTSGQFIASHSKILLCAFNRASEETQTQVRNAIEALENSNNEESSGWAKELRDVFALPAPITEIDEVDPSEGAV